MNGSRTLGNDEVFGYARHAAAITKVTGRFSFQQRAAIFVRRRVMRILRNVLSISIGTIVAAIGVYAYAASGSTASFKEDYIREPLPPGFQVIVTELEGPIFADAQGKSFYYWPKKQLRNGDAGEVQGKPTCGFDVARETAGFLSPYPPGIELPEVDTRPSCAAAWPPVFASDDAKPVGKWTIVDRLDGRKQWAYDGWSLYTSFLDKKPGDVYGASQLFHHGETNVQRYPMRPAPNVPPQFSVQTTMLGRLVVLHDDWSVYTFDGDGRNKSNCEGACLDGWAPVLSAASARSVGEWSVFERTPGVKQWAFRGKPIYRHMGDSKIAALDGSDTPRWHNVYTQMAPEPPQGFTMKKTLMGLVLGDANQKTVYQYVCGDDAIDQLACDHPDAPQAYRFAVCGGGDPDKCIKAFPYLIAPVGAKSGNQVWGTMYIDPKTGKRATADKPGALNVWTFRARPVYTFAGYKGYGDRKPSDINAQSWGEFNGERNGYIALVYRDIFENFDAGIQVDLIN